MEAMTEYNGYKIVKGRWNPYNSDDLRAMKIADAQIEAEEVERIQNARTSRREQAAAEERAQLEATMQKDRKRAYNREYMRKWRQRNPEKVNATSRARYYTHKDQISNYFRAYYQTNREIIMENQRQRRAAKKAAQQGGPQ